MAVNINTILNWFKTGLKPTQAQFWASWTSFWHKEEEIPQSSISGLTNILNAKTENSQFNAHLTDVNAHAVQFAKAKIYLPGELQIFKRPGYTMANALEIGDLVVGIVQNIKIEGTYQGGDRLLLSNYTIINQLEF